ncbi:MAG: single-stranded DNA-binding protein [Oscillospiraceae bacterium]|jgi:single-strand DNA-binding protein|nr:single-stranded DNA-binding protein [Oscillospiraceae bacterium]
MLNKVILMGRLTRDPELRYTQSNIPVVSFSLAVDRNYRSKTDNQSQADFINCVAWRQTAEFVSKWFAKGRMMVVVGTLQSRRYQDKNGENRTAMEVIADEVFFGDSKRPDDDGSRFASQPGEGSPFTRFEPSPAAPPDFGSEFPDSGFAELEDDDELPF